MEPSAFLSEPATSPGTIAILGAGPAGLVLAISLARRGLSATVIERDVPPDNAPRFNPDRSYTIDISGHGLKALRHIEAVAEFDRRIFRFKGLKIPGRERRSGHCLGGPDRGAIRGIDRQELRPARRCGWGGIHCSVGASGSNFRVCGHVQVLPQLLHDDRTR